MARLLLDTHVLLWLMSGLSIGTDATLAINKAQRARSLYVSPISAWEIGAGLGKKNPTLRPDVQDLSPDTWFASAVEKLLAKVPPLDLAVAIEAATVPSIYGSGDPGDCFLIATARVRNLTMVTRDAKILELARRDPAYLKVIEC